MLMGQYGRLDNRDLYEFVIKPKKEKEKQWALK